MVKLEIWIEGPVYYRLPSFAKLEAVINRQTFEGMKQYSYFTINCDWYMQIVQYEKRNCCVIRYYIVKNGESYYLIVHSSGCEQHPGIIDYRDIDKEVAAQVFQASRKEQPTQR
ncbi:MAG: hypothetical protein QXX87_00690 [Candidatus Jordarchaeales archaeon]